MSDENPILSEHPEVVGMLRDESMVYHASTLSMQENEPSILTDNDDPMDISQLHDTEVNMPPEDESSLTWRHPGLFGEDDLGHDEELEDEDEILQIQELLAQENGSSSPILSPSELPFETPPQPIEVEAALTNDASTTPLESRINTSSVNRRDVSLLLNSHPFPFTSSSL